MQKTSLSSKQAFEKSTRHRGHKWTHKKAGQRTFAMAKKARGGTMKIPRIHVNPISMLKNVRKCDSFGTKLF